ncbi:MAG: serine/threonine protein kinase [Myxococcales bacterium]|nr:serine/threonine protein kinase [Myxococcales bacterium]
MSPPQEQDPSLDSLDSFPGRLIAGNFRVERLIGQGAMGNVYKAEQLSLGKAVAVKVLHPHLMSDEKLVGRFKREAKSASRLNHPNSIQIIDSGQDADGTLYIAMELLAGRDLAQVIRDDFPLPLPRVVRIMTQVMSALDEAHAQGVIHRDLKPSNIMLIERRGEQDFVKVCDFGIAKATTPDGKDQDEDRQQMLTIQGLVCGTPEYMSPEQARAEPLDGRADLYSAAIILYQLITGDIPYKADSPMGIVSRHLAEVPMAPSRRRPDLPIPKSIDEVILRGMEKSREARYPTAVAFRAALETVVSATQGQYTPVPPGLASAAPTTPAFGAVTPPPTALIPPTTAAERFGSTADLTTKRPSKATPALLVGALVLVAGGAAAFMATRGATSGSTPTTQASVLSPPVVPAAPPTAAPVVAPAAPMLPPAEAPAPVDEVAAPAPPHHAATTRERNHRRSSGGSGHPVERTEHAAGVAPPAASEEPPAATAVKVPSASASVSSGPPPETTPAMRGPRDVLAEGERLLGQGEVAEACARGEEAKRMSGKQPLTYKFLGKCYMRAGRSADAKENYKKYLELSPAASDAPFIKSMLK